MFGTPGPEGAPMPSATTNDGVRLEYIDNGEGQPLVMIPGWSQTAEQFRYQIDGLSDRYRVIAVDLRGHGESEKVDHGYRISRLAQDVHDLLTSLDLNDVVLLGHSMGCSVIWNYWDLYGAERLSKLILVDQSPFLTSNSAWSDEELEASGALFDAQALYDTCNALAGPDGEATTVGFIGGMVTGAISEDEKDWIIQRNFTMPRAYAAELLYNHCTQDWRDVIPRINLPTLVVGGRVSMVPWKAVEWISGQIGGSRLEIFEEDEGGQHFMFIEGSEKFNQLLSDFIG